MLSSPCTHGASGSIHSAKKEGKKQTAELSGRSSFPGCGAGPCLSWFEGHLRDAEIPVVGASMILRQGHIPSHVLQTWRR